MKSTSISVRCVVAQGSMLTLAACWAATASAQTVASEAGASAPVQASAPTEPQAHEEAFGDIVVTAQKRSESLRNVPVSVAAFTSETLETRGISTINDLGRQSPGLMLSERQNRVPNVVLRGIGSYGFVEGVGFYVDDVQNYTDKTTRLEDLERVEILKGPQGTLFGGSSLGGAVRYISKRPTFERAAQINADVGTQSYQNAYASLNLPVVDDVVAIRASGYYSHDNGFNFDSNIRESTSASREYGLRGQLLVKPASNLTTLITARYRDFNGAYASYARQNSVTDVNTATALTFKPNYRTQTFGVVGESTLDLDELSLVSLSSYAHQKIDYVLDGDYTPAAAVKGQADGRPAWVVTQELRLTKSGGAFDWILGAYASVRRNIGGQVRLAVTAGPTTIDPYTDQTSRQTEYAAFGSGNLHFGDSLTLTGGARVMRTTYKQQSLVVRGAPVTVNRDLTVADTVVLPKVSFSYKTPGRTLLYASIAEGYEPGKVDSSARPPVAYKPETGWTYEVGAKGDLGRSIYYELSAFYIDSRDRQGESLVFTPGTTVATKRVTNIGPARSIGAEAMVRWRPVSGLDLDGSLGYLDAKWTGDAVFNNVSVSGRQIPNAPRWSANLAATYEVALDSDLELRLHSNAAYKSSFPWQLSYDPISNTNPAYWLVNARIALATKSGNWEVAARVDNLFDQRYFTEFFPQQLGVQTATGTCVGCHLAATGGLRRFVVSTSVKF